MHEYLVANLFTSGIFDRQLLKLPAIETSSPVPVHRNTVGYLTAGLTSTDFTKLPASSSPPPCCKTFSSFTYTQQYSYLLLLESILQARRPNYGLGGQNCMWFCFQLMFYVFGCFFVDLCLSTCWNYFSLLYTWITLQLFIVEGNIYWY